MQLLHINGFKQTLREVPEVPHQLKEFAVEGSVKHRITWDGGVILIQKLKFAEFDVYYHTYLFDTASTVAFFSRRRFYFFHCCLRGGFLCRTSRSEEIKITRDEYNIYLVQDTDLICTFPVPGVHIHLVIRLHDRLAGHYKKALPAGILPQKQGSAIFECMSTQHQLLSEEMHDALRSILKHHFTSPLRPRLMRLKVDELVILAAIYFQKGKQRVPLSKNETDTLHEVRQFVTEHFDEHFSIPILARKFGVNTTFLKRGFHQLFDKGLFAYLVDIRMAKAKEMLLTNNYSVREIAIRTGYKSFGSFINVFKKHYKATPGQIRRQS